MTKTQKLIIAGVIFVAFLLIVGLVPHENLTRQLANWTTNNYGFLIGIDYAILAILFVLTVFMAVYNFFDLSFRKKKFYRDDIVKEMVGNPDPPTTSDVFLKNLDEYQSQHGDHLSKLLKEAAEECEGTKSYADYYNAAGWRIEKHMREAPKIDEFYTIGTIAPAAGFLGTLIGMVQVLTGKGADDIRIVTAGLLIAILTSIAGLVILIASAVFAHLFSSQAEMTRNEMLSITRTISNKIKGLSVF